MTSKHCSRGIKALFSRGQNWVRMRLKQCSQYGNAIEKDRSLRREWSFPTQRTLVCQAAKPSSTHWPTRRHQQLSELDGHFLVQFQMTISSRQNATPACFQSFPCCDASLRNKGCYTCITARILFVFVKVTVFMSSLLQHSVDPVHLSVPRQISIAPKIFG